MKIKNLSKTHLFLIELIVVILFFSFACSIAVQVFAKADHLEGNATALNESMLAVQSAAEIDKNTDLQEIDLARQPTYFNKRWQIVDSENAAYKMTYQVDLQNREAGTMAIFTYTVASIEGGGNEIIYHLQAKKYYSGETVTAASQTGGGPNE
ncbi:MAG: hypothetical protein ACOX7H_06045 [Bacillota bacterium]|jgi:type II secretory pathway pseudopilin PulG